jgi:hypothetical protein
VPVQLELKQTIPECFNRRPRKKPDGSRKITENKELVNQYEDLEGFKVINKLAAADSWLVGGTLLFQIYYI